MQQAFILGNPRSGTSLLRLMLDSHPQMAAPPECGFLHWWYNKYAHWSWQSGTVEQYVDDLLTSKKIETWVLDRQRLLEHINQQKPDTYGDLGVLIYQFWAISEGKTPEVIIDKNNYYVQHLADLLHIWPQAKFLFLIRDGRDVACSYKEIEALNTNSQYKPKLPVRIEDIAKEWLGNNLEIKNFLAGLPTNCWMLIKYENLVTQPEDELRRVADFFNLTFTDQMLKYYLRDAEPKSTLDWKLKTLEIPDRTNVGKYKVRLTPAEIGVFNSIAHEILKFGGYE